MGSASVVTTEGNSDQSIMKLELFEGRIYASSGRYYVHKLSEDLLTWEASIPLPDYNFTQHIRSFGGSLFATSSYNSILYRLNSEGNQFQAITPAIDSEGAYGFADLFTWDNGTSLELYATTTGDAGYLLRLNTDQDNWEYLTTTASSSYHGSISCAAVHGGVLYAVTYARGLNKYRPESNDWVNVCPPYNVYYDSYKLISYNGNLYCGCRFGALLVLNPEETAWVLVCQTTNPDYSQIMDMVNYNGRLYATQYVQDSISSLVRLASDEYGTPYFEDVLGSSSLPPRFGTILNKDGRLYLGTEGNGNIYQYNTIAGVSIVPSVTNGPEPLTVDFTIEGSIDFPATSYVWDFGDGAQSVERNPAHFYVNPGFYTVTLTITGDSGTFVVRKENYIRVTGKYTYDIAPDPDKEAYLSGIGMVFLRNVGVELRKIRA